MTGPNGADETILSVRGLSVALPRGADRRFAVEDASIEVRRAEIVCVVGESGSGKSVLSSAVMGAVPPPLRIVSGSVVIQGEDIARASAARLRQIRGSKAAYIFQEPMAALNPAIPVGRQLEEVFELHAPSMSASDRRRRTLELFTATHLPDPEAIAGRYPHQISGGQCQRVVIAMALAMNPALLIADEPTTALDVTTQARILDLVRELKTEHRHGILFITHDFGVVSEIADRIAVMQQGRIVETGPADQVLNAPRHPYTQKLVGSVPSLVPARRESRPDGDALLRIDRLEKHFGRVAALKDVSLALPPGKTLAIVGESGSGKSTLAKATIRLLAADGGRVYVRDVEFSALRGSALRRARRRLQMIFQDPFGSLNPRHRVGDVIARAGRLGGLSAAEAKARALELLELVGLPAEAFARRPTAFSGGQRQRIGIARALAMGPEVVIADESVSALDVSVQKQVLELLDDLQKRLGLTILFITHDLRVAAQISDYIAVMRRGEVVEYGPAAELLAHPIHEYTRELLAAAPGRDWTPPVLARAGVM
jgi:peptide/nickel transport system ATP-binding protein